MAIIDRAKENVRMNVSAPVPIGSGEFAGAPGRALERVGDKLMGIGVDLYKAEATSKANQAAVELESFYKNARNQAIQQSAADGSDIEEKYNDIVSQGAGAIKEKYSGNVLANTQIENFDSRARAGELDDLKTIKIKKAEAYHSGVIEQIQAAEVNKVYNAKNNFEMKAYLSSAIVSNNRLIDEQVNNGVISPTKAYELKETFRGALADNLLDGMVQRKDFGQALAYVGGIQEDTSLFTEISPEQAKKLGFVTAQEAAQLSEKGENFKVAAMTKKDKMKTKMTPEEAYVMSALPQSKRESLRKKLEDKMQVEAHMKMSDLNAKLNAMEKLSFSARNLPDSFFNSAITEVNNNPLLSPEARSRLGGQIAIMKSVNMNMSRITEVPIGKQSTLLADAEQSAKQMIQGLVKLNPQFKEMDKDVTIQAYQLEARQKMQSAIEAFNQDVKEDSKRMILATSKELQVMEKASADAGHTPEGSAAFRQYNEAILAKQKALGYPEKLLTKAEAMEFSAYLQTTVNSSDAYQYVMNTKKKFGEHFPRVMDEVIKADPKLKGYAAVMYTNEVDAKPLVDAIKNKENLLKEFGDSGPYSGMAPLLKQQIAEANAPLRKMFIKGGQDLSDLSAIQGIEEAVTLVAQQDIIKNGTPVDKAAVDAYDRVIKQNYHIVDTGRSSVLVPRAIDPQLNKRITRPDNIEGFIRVYSEPNNFRDLGVDAPNSEEDTTQYYIKLAQRAKWVTNPTQTGIKLVEVNPRTGTHMTVYDKQGKPVERSYQEIYENPSEKVKKKWKDTGAKFETMTKGISDVVIQGRGTAR